MVRNTRLCPWIGLAALTLSGCISSHRVPDELATAVSQGEHKVAMRGEAMFFDNQLQVSITIGRGIGKGTMGSGGKGHHHGGGNAELMDTQHMDDDERTAYISAKVAVGSPMPPVTIHLRIQNKSAQTVSVDVSDFDSYLGNFAVQPEVIAASPGQTSEPDPMVSQMGVTSDIIPVTVTLKMNGQKETKVVQVKNIMTPASEEN